MTDSWGDGWNGNILTVGAETFGLESGSEGTALLGFCGVTGCTDATACNYNPDATADDGSCLQDLGCGCGEPGAAEGFDCDGNCIEGSNLTVDGGSWQYEVGWTITDCDGNEILTGGAPFSGCVTLPDNYNITMTDSWGCLLYTSPSPRDS